MHETQQHAQPPSRGSTALHAKKRRFSRKATAAALAVVCALVAIPAAGFAANTFGEDYSWYKNATGSTYTIKTPAQWNAFTNLVNGSADAGQAGAAEDSFDGKTVELGANLNFFGQDVLPAGGQGGHAFNGKFDGNGHEIGNLKINAQGATTNVGLIGAAGEGSSISNVKLNGLVSLTIAETDNTKAIENMGLLVGSSKGSISNVTNAGTLSVSHSMDQTKSIVFPIKNVGGVAGICTGDITGVTNTGSISVSEPGAPYKADASDKEWEDQSILAINIGGVVGSAGDVDTSIDAKSAGAHGSISGCTNSGTLKVDTPKDDGLDRFGNQVYSQSSNMGGVAGYSRGSISGCTNTGYIEATHAAGSGGIVGGLRAKTTTTSYSGNFSQEGSDDGLATGADKLSVTDCFNSGSVYGYSFPAGIVGRAGTGTEITGCVNESAATILGSRATKPFPAGIVGSSYGTVAYCGNLGTVVAGSWSGSIETLKLSSGYFASGIAGNLSYFTKNVDGEQQRVGDLPELYGCYNEGKVEASGSFRQRLLVGDNGGYVHDNVAVSGRSVGSSDKLVYGMYEDDTESSGGAVYNNVLLGEADVKANNAFDLAKQDTVSRYNPNTTNAIAVLNANASKDGWAKYWAKSDGTVNSGFPALNTQITWEANDLSGATVEFAANAQYTGLTAVPQAKVTLNGAELQQNIDFRVIPDDASAVNVTAGDEKPYTAHVEGIGSYKGSAGSFSYGIGKGDLANCTVTIDTKIYNWKAQEPTAANVHVYNMAGKEVASGEYTFGIDQNSKLLSNIDADGYATDVNTGTKGAVNAKKYAVNLTAVADSEHFVGTTVGTFAIKTAKIIWDKDSTKLEQNAYPVSVSYDGKVISFPNKGTEKDTNENIAWDSLTLRSDLAPALQDEGLLDVAYTGTNVKPAVNQVVYKGKDLVEGRDYKVVYGASLNEGEVVPADKANLGKEGGSDFGYVMARYIAGSNFSNYDIMKFKITDQGALDIAEAQVKGTEDIVFEQGGVYTPVTVWYGGSQLKEGTDYDITYTGNNALGTASFTITGKGLYTGEKSGKFNLVEGTPYELQYTFADDGTAKVTGVEYNGALDAFNLAIPETVEHDGKRYAVTAIGNKAFGGLESDFSGSKANESKTKVASVSVPATVKSLGTYAFGSSLTGGVKMTQLTSVAFAEGSQLETIGNLAFSNTGITDVVIPAGVQNIGRNAFAGLNGKLQAVTFLSTSASTPAINESSVDASFFGVYNVTAKAYEGTAAASFCQKMAASANKWTFESMGKVPEVTKFAVSFNAMGGEPAPAAQTIEKGQKASAPETNPAKDGYTFEGWFESADGGATLADKAFDFNTEIQSDLVLYAKWTKVGEPEQPILTVSEQDSSGNELSAKSYTLSALKALASSADDELALGQFYGKGAWSVYASDRYVTYDRLLADAGVEAADSDVIDVGINKNGNTWTPTLGQLRAGKYYGSAQSASDLGEATRTVPAGLALSYGRGSGSSVAEAEAAAKADMTQTENAPMQVAGVTDDGSTAGYRFWSGVAKVVVKHAEKPTAGITASIKADAATGVYGESSVRATVETSASDGSPLSYQWYRVDPTARARVAGTPIEGATSATYELPVGTPAGTYTVYCVVSAEIGGETVTTTTDPVDLVVAKAPNSIAWDGEGFDASSNSVTVTAQANPATAADGETSAAVQYAISSSASADASALAWQDSASFTGLDADATYYVYAKVSGLPNYTDKVSVPLKVQTQAVGAVENPVLAAVTYDPQATLADVELPEGWEWADASVVPTVEVGAYAAVFTPTAEQLASTDYSVVEGWDVQSKTVKRQVALTVNKATPAITAAPSASDLTFGQTLAESTLTGGSASVAGEFTWDDPQRLPQVAESGQAAMKVQFVPADSDNYNTVVTNVAVKVAPKNLSQGVVTITVPGQTYTGSALEPALTVVYNGVTLAAGTDYDVVYANNVEVGTASYTVTFKGNYTGTASGTFAISKAPAAVVPADQGTTPAGTNGNGAPAAGNAAALAPTADSAATAAAAAAACALVAAAGVAFARRRMSR